MSIDRRTRMLKDVRPLQLDEVLDRIFPDACEAHSDIAARGIRYRDLPPLGLDVDGTQLTLRVQEGRPVLEPGLSNAGVVARLSEDALSDLVQDYQSTMGLAMTARVQLESGSMDDWVGWEPALRALLDGRKVYETGDVTFIDRDGAPLDLDRTFSLDDDREEIAHFLREAGFLHLRGIFDEAEMDEIGTDIDASIADARDGDPGYWWCTDATGTEVAVRSLDFQEKSAAVRAALGDERLAWIGELTGDGHVAPTTCEGLVKPLDIVTGLSDLPWHKDCGQGLHSYKCNSLTVGISVTGADRSSGALGVIPGSHLLMGEERLTFASTVSSLPLTEVPATACTTSPGDVIGARALPLWPDG